MNATDGHGPDTPHVGRIFVYPIKSLPGVQVEQATVLADGALADDRRWAVCDVTGALVTAKRTPRVHALRARFALDEPSVSLRTDEDETWHEFSLAGDRGELAAWLSTFFGLQVRVKENVEMGFPDDTESPGPTVVGAATLETVAGWFAGMSLEEVRERFRANLEVDGVEPFWEDRLYTANVRREVPFRLGGVTLLGTTPCQRCVVPTRHPMNGEPTAAFARLFSERRAATLPEWAAAERFDHFYRLTTNTRVRVPGVIRVGDPVAIV